MNSIDQYALIIYLASFAILFISFLTGNFEVEEIDEFGNDVNSYKTFPIFLSLIPLLNTIFVVVITGSLLYDLYAKVSNRY